jgi:signal peptidase II
MLPYILILLAFAADRISKWWATNYFNENGPLEVGTFITLSPTYNQGISFGMFQGIGRAVGWISIIIIIGLFIYMIRTPKSMWLLRIGLALIIGGALGNMVDRIVAGKVLDFIQATIRPGVFNVADLMVNAGMIISLIGVILQREEKSPEEPLEQAEL